MESPEDSTAVIRMKRDFDSFLSRSRHGIPFDLDRNITPPSKRQALSSESSALSVKALLDKEAKLKDADLAAAQSKIAELEAEIISLTTARKHAKIELESDYIRVKKEKEFYEEKLKEMRTQLKYVSDKETSVQEELRAAQKELKEQKVQYDSKLQTLQKNNLQLHQEKQELQDKSWEKISELKKEAIRYQTEADLIRNELEECMEHLKIHKRKSANYTEILEELEQCRKNCIQAEQKVTDLERTISRMEEDAKITNAMKSQLTAMPLLEKDNKRLTEENAFLKETQGNNMLLKEQAESFKSQLERTEARYADYANVVGENTDLKSRLEKWEKAEKESGHALTPSRLSKQLSHLQEQQAVLLEKQGHLQSSLHLERQQCCSLQEKYDALSSQFNTERSKAVTNVDLLKRLQRKLVLVTKERDGYKQIIDSYESEVTANIGALSSSRLQQQEEVIEGYRKQVEQQDRDITRLARELQNERVKGSVNGNTSMSNLNSSFSNRLQEESDQKLILQLRERIEKLEKQLEKTEEEKFVLETRIEQRHLQGDYDPTKTKVLHFTMNPVAIAQHQRKEEVTRLKEENEKLKQRLLLLEESGGKVEDLTVQVEQKLQEPSTSKEVDEMKAQLSREETKNKRLMEAFKKTSQEFREVCYQLTGYRIDISCSKQYKITSMYAESPDDFFLFQQSGEGEVQMLETDYSRTLKDSIELYLNKQDSIPAFLSSVTLDLFSRQTMQIS